MPAYSLAAPYARPPLRRRISGLALALAINAALLAILMTLGIIPPPSAQKVLRGVVVDLIPEQSRAAKKLTPQQTRHSRAEPDKRVTKPPPIVLPSKPTIVAPPRKPAPWLEMSKDELAAADISKLGGAGSGSAGDSEVVGQGPSGEALYAAQWAREPTNAELSGYMPRRGVDGFGLVACRTIANDRVEDCQELDQTLGSHLASAIRQAAWQFRVRPPRKGGKPLIKSWVRIRIDYYNASSFSEDRPDRPL